VDRVQFAQKTTTAIVTPTTAAVSAAVRVDEANSTTRMGTPRLEGPRHALGVGVSHPFLTGIGPISARRPAGSGRVAAVWVG
jgi:hypothetical protein